LGFPKDSLRVPFGFLEDSLGGSLWIP
jgi:hypothetical protein